MYPSRISVESNLPYDRYPQTVLDIMRPKTEVQGNRPGVLVIHGGGWVGGSKEGVVERFVLPWVNQGCVVANVEYRLAAVAPAPLNPNREERGHVPDPSPGPTRPPARQPASGAAA